MCQIYSRNHPPPFPRQPQRFLCERRGNERVDARGVIILEAYK